jgi:hypothetical protein
MGHSKTPPPFSLDRSSVQLVALVLDRNPRTNNSSCRSLTNWTSNVLTIDQKKGKGKNQKDLAKYFQAKSKDQHMRQQRQRFSATWLSTMLVRCVTITLAWKFLLSLLSPTTSWTRNVQDHSFDRQVKGRWNSSSTTPALVFLHEAPPLFEPSQNDNSVNEGIDGGSLKRCVVFSCSTYDYELVQLHWRASETSICDRYHFFGHVRQYDDDGEVESNWCRVALLDDPHGILSQYSTIIYVDVDIVFNETAFVQIAASNSNKTWTMSYKKEILGRPGGKNQEKKKKNRPRPIVRTMRTCSFIINNHTKALPMIHTWAKNYRPNAELQDQTVWNELYSCRHNENDVKCYGDGTEKSRQQYGELKHCASWMDKTGRKVCFLSKTWSWK